MSTNFNQITCGQCALKTPDGQTCLRFGMKITDKGCGYGSTQLFTCDNCGRPIFPENVFFDSENSKIVLCSRCAKASNTCALCCHSIGCFFNESSNPTPKMVQKTVQINGGYAVTQIMNPERIRNTCKKGCPCFSEEFGCSRQNNWCNNHNYKL